MVRMVSVSEDGDGDFLGMMFSYPENRTIIRQDQRPACFYILLSGSAIINYQRYTDAHVQTLDILDRGCTFGVRVDILILSSLVAL